MRVRRLVILMAAASKRYRIMEIIVAVSSIGIGKCAILFIIGRNRRASLLASKDRGEKNHKA